MKKLWMTSSEPMISFTGRPTGTCSSLISRCPSMCCDLPHPLLADDVDFHRAVGRRASGGRRPARPSTNITIVMPSGMIVQSSSSASEPWIAHADLVVVPAAELDREDDDQRRDEQREERRDGDQEEVQRVDLRRLRPTPAAGRTESS